MQITRGKRARAQKVVIYGPEGIGKSSFAAQFPEPVFIDTEGSTDNMDVARLDKPTSWTMLKNQISFIKANPSVCKTLVIDTVDWAEQLIVDDICAQHGKKGIEDFGWGNGYTYAREEMGRFLNLLSELVELGINVVLTAHAQTRKFEQPDEMGAYDRWELKLGKKTSSQTAPLVKEWADMVLFANYKTVVMTTDTGKKKAQGGTRVLYTQHHPAWDAKNRHDLPDKLPLDYASIAHIFNQNANHQQQPQQTQVVQQAEQITQETLTDVLTEDLEKVQDFSRESYVLSEIIPKNLRDLMMVDRITEEELKDIQKDLNHLTPDTPLENYPENYFDFLVSYWDTPNENGRTIKDIILKKRHF